MTDGGNQWSPPSWVPPTKEDEATGSESSDPVTETDTPPVADTDTDVHSTPAPSTEAAERPLWQKLVAVGVVALLIGALIGSFVGGDDGEYKPIKEGLSSPSQADDASATPGAIRSVLEKVQPAVVSIQGRSTAGSESGTGMILTSDGEILTNAHVVAGSQQLQVTVNGEQQARSATVVGSDESIDSAIIKLDRASNMPTVELGQSGNIQVGDQVVAIGNALALAGGPTVTTGIISAKDRSLEGLDGLIQTDAAINPGNSGGPLVNMAGQVVGMNTAVIRGSGGEFQNIGFALGIDSVKPALEDLRRGRITQPAYLGVSTVTLDSSIRERFSLTPERGAVVETVSPGSPAQQAGLARFDVITQFDGEDISTNADLVNKVRVHRPGDRVKVVWFRGDQRTEREATLVARPQNLQ